ncbi:hypothetical protein JKF63_06005 [Porcisia hertigi]|uniref:Uncharacterized protein n=1 Tax=Porcisia hertigi TaxID=2761500 RepID=A0A836HVF4_9TRYP|nr:hypothetical protein JKF63_06005 [Porcisia hertigi]
MEAPAERRTVVRLRRFAATTHDSSPSVSLNRGSFHVHRAAPTSVRAVRGGTRRILVPLQQPPSNRLSSSYTRLSHASPVASAHDVATAAPSVSFCDTSCLSLDLLEPVAARWASTAGRGGGRVPRVRSALGPQSEVVDTGVFVSPDTIVAALYSAAPERGHLVVTAESGGWLRVREQQTGAIRYQQRLRDGGEASCLAWVPAAGDTSIEPFGAVTVVVVGQLSGLISFHALVGESLVELPSATCVFHKAPLLSCLSVHAPASAAGPAETPPGAFLSTLLSLDADGVVALWCLRVARTGRIPGRGGAAEAQLSVVLLDCRRASPLPFERFVASTTAHSAEEEAPPPPPPPSSFPPVVMSAAALSSLLNSPCCVLSTHRFVQHGLSATCAAGGDETTDAQGNAVVFLLSCVAPAACPSATELVIDSGATTSLEGEGVPVEDSAQSRSRLEWEVLRVYRVPLRELSQRGGKVGAASVDATHVAVTALCVTEYPRLRGGATPAEQLWAGTSDGRLFIWQAHTGQFLRCLHSTSAAPVHSLTSVLSFGSPEHVLVWASQADGSVVAWSADTYTVAEVLPVSYPPPGPLVSGSGKAEDPMGGVGSAEVVTVRDAVDLLRATRHHSAQSTSCASWRRDSGFTLFLKPMALVCMQRAWSVSTDGTVRTWLLPAGSASADGGVADSPTTAFVDSPRKGAGNTACAASLDICTVQSFLQDRADALVRERQMHRLASEALHEELQNLQERNKVLAGALQQATSRLERVSGDVLVRSTSPAGSPPPDAASEKELCADTTVAKPVVVPPPPPRLPFRMPRDNLSGAPQPSTAVANPDAAHLPPPPLEMLPSAARMHVQALRQLLEELHAKLEESWSRNDALREELLLYQLRTLEYGEDTTRPMHTTAAAGVAVATAAIEGAWVQVAATRGVASTGTSTSAASLLPSPHAVSGRLSMGTPGHDAQLECGVHGGHLRTPPLPQAYCSANANCAASMDNRTPFPVFRSPSVEELVHSRSTKARPLAPPPSREMVPTEEVTEKPSVEAHRTSPSCIEAVSCTSTAAERFLKAASAVLHTSTSTEGGTARRGGGIGGPARVPTPPLLRMEVEDEVYVEEVGCIDVDNGKGPALVGAWCTSEDDLSPILSQHPGPAPSGGAVTFTDPHATHGGWHMPLPTSLFSSSFISAGSSVYTAADGDGRGDGDVHRLVASEDAVPSKRAAAIWTTPTRAEGRGHPADGGAWARAPVATAHQLGFRAGDGSVPASASESGVLRIAPIRHSRVSSAAASPPRAFRSPIIYRFT